MPTKVTPVQPNAPITLRDYLAPVRRRWKMIVVMVVLITAAVSAYTATRPRIYTAATEVFIGPQSDAALGIAASEPSPEAIANQAALLTTTGVAARVAPTIHYPGSAAALAGSVTATPSQTTNFLMIESTQPSSALAAKVVNAYAQEFISRNSSSQLALGQQQITTLQKQLRALKGPANANERQSIQGQIQQLQLANSSVVGTATQVNIATGGVESAKSPIEAGVLAAIAALIGCIALAFMLERLDPSFRSVLDTEGTYGLPVLAAITNDPSIERFVDGKPGLSPHSREYFRELHVGLELAAGEKPFKTILLTSAVPNEGKSTVARNLALAISEADRRVLLLDADLRRPRLAKSVGATPQAGITEILTGQRTREEVTLQIEAAPASSINPPIATNGHSVGDLPPGFRAVPRFWFIGSGSAVPNPPALLGSENFHRLIDELSGAFDVVIIDSSPVVAVPDAIAIAPWVDAVVVIARSSTDSRSAQRASELIRRVPNANIVGLVVNDVPWEQAAVYGYGYGYGSYGYRYAAGPADRAADGVTVPPGRLDSDELPGTTPLSG
jgi:Mrp family chromosome partitioning ATPase/capsular polysaccharide biosynthesis protein